MVIVVGIVACNKVIVAGIAEVDAVTVVGDSVTCDDGVVGRAEVDAAVTVVANVVVLYT